MREPALPDVTAKRRYVADLEIGESVDTVFLLSEHHPGKTKNDDWYLRTKFSDKSGTIAGIMWSDSGAEEAAKNTKEGDHVRVVGVVDLVAFSIEGSRCFSAYVPGGGRRVPGWDLPN